MYAYRFNLCTSLFIFHTEDLGVLGAYKPLQGQLGCQGWLVVVSSGHVLDARPRRRLCQLVSQSVSSVTTRYSEGLAAMVKICHGLGTSVRFRVKVRFRVLNFVFNRGGGFQTNTGPIFRRSTVQIRTTVRGLGLGLGLGLGFRLGLVEVVDHWTFRIADPNLQTFGRKPESVSQLGRVSADLRVTADGFHPQTGDPGGFPGVWSRGCRCCWRNRSSHRSQARDVTLNSICSYIHLLSTSTPFPHFSPPIFAFLRRSPLFIFFRRRLHVICYCQCTSILCSLFFSRCCCCCCWNALLMFTRASRLYSA